MATDYAGDRVRLAHYLAVSWRLTISCRLEGGYELSVTQPSDAIPAKSPVDVFALKRETLEVFVPTGAWDTTALHEAARRTAADFPKLLDAFSES